MFDHHGHNHRPPHPSDELGFSEIFLISGVAAIISKTAAAPIERVKLMIQNQDEMLKHGRISEPYKGVIDCTMKTYRSEGFLPFWRGNFANCLLYFPQQALNFAFKDSLTKTVFTNRENESSALAFSKNIASGGIGGALSLCFVYSLSYARTRLAADAKVGRVGEERQYKGLVDVYSKTFRSDGFVGLYRGFVISCVGIVVYRGCYFGFYDTLKPILFGDHAGMAISFALGYVVTIVAGTISYPLDTVCRRMMMTSGQPVKYESSFDCALQIMRNEGAMSFMKGAGANILRGVAGAGVLAGFDKFKELYILWRLP